MKLSTPVFVIGFMGAGKTTIARKVARRAHVASVDADSYLERSLGRTIADIFATDGEAAFRRFEARTLEDLASRDPMLIACGGGVITTAEARTLLRDRGFVIYLKVDPDEAARRIEDASSRPLFQDPDEARRLWQRRQALYEEVADVTIETGGKGPGQLSDEVVERLQAAGVLVDDGTERATTDGCAETESATADERATDESAPVAGESAATSSPSPHPPF